MNENMSFKINENFVATCLSYNSTLKESSAEDFWGNYLIIFELASVAQSDAYQNGNKEVAGSILPGLSKLLWRIVMKYFLWSFSPFTWFKKASCQFLAKECAQVQVKCLED